MSTPPLYAASSDAEWPTIDRLGRRPVPVFPVSALPDVIRQWVEAESLATQTPSDLAALLTLAVVSATIARRVVVCARPGFVEPTNLYTAILLGPGNRKSAVFSDTLKPLREHEQQLKEAARPTIAIAESNRRQDEAALKEFERLAAKGDGCARNEAEKLAAKLAQQPPIAVPELIVDDVTPEKLATMLKEQAGRIASMSPEGCPFDLMSGMYSKNGLPNIDVYLKGHAGDDFSTHRIGRESTSVQRPALTCAYAIQPAVIEELPQKALFRGRGLLARFLYAIPESWVGRRRIAPPPVPDQVRTAYHNVVANLACFNGSLKLRLAADALTLFQDWEEEIELMLAEGGALEAIRDWGAKLAGATLRLSASLHCAESGLVPAIGRQTVADAIEIARYLIPHAQAVLGSIKTAESLVEDDAAYVLRWIQRHGRAEFTKRDAQQHGRARFPHADDINAALVELTRRGYIRQLSGERAGVGRPGSPRYEVNPAVFDPAPDVGSQNTQKFQADLKEMNSEYCEHGLQEPGSGISDDEWGEL